MSVQSAEVHPGRDEAPVMAATGDNDTTLAEEARRILAEPRRSNPGRFARLEALAVRWMAHDPAGAVAFLRTLEPGDGHRFGMAALSAWFDRDPQSALKFAAEQLSRNEDTASWLSPIFEKLAFESGTMELDLLKAFLDTLPATESVYRGLDSTFVRIAKHDLVQAEAFAATLPVEKARKQLYAFVGIRKAQDGGMEPIREVAEGPTTLPGREAQVEAGLNFLIRHEFAAVAAWVDAQPPTDYLDTVRRAMAWQYAPSDIEAAVKAADAIVNDEMRRSHVKLYLIAWLKRDYTPAEEWALASRLSAFDVAQAIVEARATMVKPPPVDYLARVEAAQRLPDTKASRRQLGSDLPGWLNQDRAETLRWMSANARDEEERRFFESQIRRVPVERPPPPKPGEVGDSSSF